MLTYFCVLIYFTSVDGRVFCKSPNSHKWTAMGISCPINCHNIAKAVETLKMIDYERFMIHDPTLKDVYEIWSNTSDPTNATMSRRRTIDLDIKDLSEADRLKFYHIYIQHKGIYNTLSQFKKGYQDRIHDRIRHKLCRRILKRGIKTPSVLIGHMVANKCVTESEGNHDYVTVLTVILNRYGNSQYQVNEQMILLLLEKLFGKDADVHNGMFDMRLVMEYWQKALQTHESQLTENVIRLRAAHCLTLHVAGCYCKQGFVENSGICVKPKHCKVDDPRGIYVKRIIVT